MDRSKNPQGEISSPLGEFVDTMRMEQSELFETFEMTLKNFEQNLNQLKESLESLETLLERLPSFEKIIPFEERKPSL